MKRYQKIVVLSSLSCLAFLLLALIFLRPGERKRRPGGAREKSVRFFGEKITLRAFEHEAEVTGVYYLRNNATHAIILPMLYPFPIDEDHYFPHEIRVFYAEGNRDIPYAEHRSARSITFSVGIPAQEITTFTVRYRQRFKANNVRYILTTTGYWGQPFEWAEYRVIVPKEMKGVTVSYPPTRVDEAGNVVHYIIEREDFMPTKDLEVRWAKRG